MHEWNICLPVSISFTYIGNESTFRPQETVTGYERKMVEANETELSDTQHMGCHFYFSHATFGKDEGL